MLPLVSGDPPAPPPIGGRRWDWLWIGAASLFSIGLILLVVETVGATLEWKPDPATTNFNLLVQGFRDGHLYLKIDVPAGLKALPDPYNPTANAKFRSYPYSLHDLSFFRGRLYLYYGPVASLIVLWPWVALTGHFLFPRHAAELFSIIGFLAALDIVLSARRRYFSEIGSGVAAAAALAVGAATGVPILLQRPGVCEVPIACSYGFAMLALAALWRGLHDPRLRWRWTAAASLAFGLAVASRPSQLFGAVMLLVPAALAWRSGRGAAAGREAAALLVAAVLPIGLIGLGLAAYNVARFEDPLEFGQHYQMSMFQIVLAPTFSLSYLLYNLRIYFLEPVALIGRYPFVRDIAPPPLPSGHTLLESPYGILSNVPFAALALAALFAGRGRPKEQSRPLRGFLAGTALLFGACALTLCLYWGGCERYEAEFLPALILLAAIGLFAVERQLANAAPARRRAARIVWGTLLAWSVAFNGFAAFQHDAPQHFDHGHAMLVVHDVPTAIRDFERAASIEPGNALFQNDLGVALYAAGRSAEAIRYLQRAVALEPRSALERFNLAKAEESLGRKAAALASLDRAIELAPNFTTAREERQRLRTGAQ